MHILPLLNWACRLPQSLLFLRPDLNRVAGCPTPPLRPVQDGQGRPSIRPIGLFHIFRNASVSHAKLAPRRPRPLLYDCCDAASCDMLSCPAHDHPQLRPLRRQVMLRVTRSQVLERRDGWSSGNWLETASTGFHRNGLSMTSKSCTERVYCGWRQIRRSGCTSSCQSSHTCTRWARIEDLQRVRPIALTTLRLVLAQAQA